MIVRPALLCGSDCWPINRIQVQRLIVAEMRMIQQMCGYMRFDRIRNELIREEVGIAPIENKMKEIRLRWFGHVKRRSVNAQMRRCKQINLPECRRGRGRLTKSQNEVIKYELNYIGLTEDITHDKSLWRQMIKIVNHRQSASSASFGFCSSTECCYVIPAIIISCI